MVHCELTGASFLHAPGCPHRVTVNTEAREGGKKGRIGGRGAEGGEKDTEIERGKRDGAERKTEEDRATETEGERHRERKHRENRAREREN